MISAGILAIASMLGIGSRNSTEIVRKKKEKSVDFKRVDDFVNPVYEHEDPVDLELREKHRQMCIDAWREKQHKAEIARAAKEVRFNRKPRGYIGRVFT